MIGLVGKPGVTRFPFKLCERSEYSSSYIKDIEGTELASSKNSFVCLQNAVHSNNHQKLSNPRQVQLWKRKDCQQCRVSLDVQWKQQRKGNTEMPS